MKKVVRVLASCFYLGYLPAPGAWGSAVGFLLAWFLPQTLLIQLAFLTLLGYCFTLYAEQAFSSKDPGPFVLDEVCGMMLSVALLPKTFVIYAAAYVLFRILDVWKPWPISILQKMKHPFSIMHDDIAAGVVANLLLQFFVKAVYK